MKTKFELIKRAARLVLLSTFTTFYVAQLSTCFAQGTAFTYQGRLSDGVSPASGIYNLTFTLFNTNTSGVAVAGPVTNTAVNVTNGLFTVLIDFGSGVFTGATNWLQIGVETNVASSFTTLTPRQQLTPVPYAIFAENANAAGISGTVPNASLSGTYGNAVILNNAGNSFSGNGGGLTNVNAATLGGLGASQFWKTTGNSNTVAGVNFLGTLDNQPLELRAGGLRALRLGPDPRPGGAAANLIGGFTNNTVEQPGSGGDVIGGGGYAGGINIIHSNSGGVFIGAGSANQIGPNVNDSFIGAGFGNTVQAYDSVIGGGAGNAIQTNSWYSFIGGGNANLLIGDSYYSVIAGGQNNTNYGTSCTIGGGYFNSIQGAVSSVIGGGYNNIIQLGGYNSIIAGGTQNTIGTYAQNETIGGGVLNTIGSLNNSATIAGGANNTIQTNAYASTIGGGYNNSIQPLAQYSTIGGGFQNTIGTNAQNSIIAGGVGNTIQSGSFSASIGGGSGNFVNGSYSTIPGGFANAATGQFSFAAGSVAQANHSGAFVWSDASSFSSFTSSTQNEFAVRASGGARFVTGGAGMTLDGRSVALRTGGNTFTGQQTITGGSVGIGVTSPLAALHVSGADGAQFRLQNSADNSYWYFSDDVNDNLVFQPNTGIGAYISRDGNYHLNSDARLKQDITPIGGVLDRVLQLRPVSYHFRSAPAGTPPTLGLIAQEVEPLFPEVVGERGGMKSMAYSELIPVTIRAVQELNQKLAEQRAELTQKETEVTELKQRLAALEKVILNQKSN